MVMSANVQGAVSTTQPIIVMLKEFNEIRRRSRWKWHGKLRVRDISPIVQHLSEGEPDTHPVCRSFGFEEDVGCQVGEVAVERGRTDRDNPKPLDFVFVRLEIGAKAARKLGFSLQDGTADSLLHL